MGKIKNYYILFLTFIIYSFSLLFSKFASMNNFIINYGISFMFMVFYAILWQLSLKRVNLNIAYSLKSVTIIISMLFGVIFLQEMITIQKVIAVLIILIGIFMVSNNE